MYGGFRAIECIYGPRILHIILEGLLILLIPSISSHRLTAYYSPSHVQLIPPHHLHLPISSKDQFRHHVPPRHRSIQRPPMDRARRLRRRRARHVLQSPHPRPARLSRLVLSAGLLRHARRGKYHLQTGPRPGDSQSRLHLIVDCVGEPVFWYFWRLA